MPSTRRQSIALDHSSVAHAFEDVRNDYNAAKNSRYRRRRTGVQAMGSHADWHYRVEADYLKIMEQARDFDRNDVIAGRAVDCFVMNTLPHASILDADTGDKTINQELEGRWLEWAHDQDQCDLAGEYTFSDMERLTLRHAVVDGDCQAIGTDGGQLQLFEGHRLRTPSNTKKNVVHGVLLDENRKRLEYWFTREDVSCNATISRVSDMRQIPVRSPDGTRQVFHALFAKRISQTRGVSAFAPIFDPVGMFEDIQFAALVKQQSASCWSILRERQLGWNGPGQPLGETVSTETVGAGRPRTIEGIAPGMELIGDPGEKLSGFSPQIPGDGFFEHSKLILTLIGINIGVPLILMLMDPSETNFSGYRGSMEQARLGFRHFWRRFVESWHCPIYRFKVAQWIADDPALLRASVNTAIKIYNHRWTPPRLTPIEPLKDSSCDLLRVRNALTSPRRLQAELGCEWGQIANEIVADNSLAIRRAKKEAARINKAFDDGAPVHWRELISLPTPDGVQIQLAPDQAELPAGNTATGAKP